MLNKLSNVTNLSFVYVCFKYAQYITSGIALFFSLHPGDYKEMSSILAPSYMSPNAGGRGELRGLSQWVKLYTEAQINFGDLTPYLTCGRISWWILWFLAVTMYKDKTQRKQCKMSSSKKITVWGPEPPPPLHAVYVYIIVYCRKYQHNWLYSVQYLQSINSDKNLPQSPFTSKFF